MCQLVEGLAQLQAEGLGMQDGMCIRPVRGLAPKRPMEPPCWNIVLKAL